MYDNNYEKEERQIKFIRIFGAVLTIVSFIWIVGIITASVIADYNYEKDYSSSWNLAEKASTIPQKAEYIDKFILKLENSPMRGEYNAIFMQTPDNSFDKNLEALKSLQLRLHEIQGMDVKSFEYNTAIQQITAQEQGEANQIISTIKSIWYKIYHPLLWNWICTTYVLFVVLLLILGIRYWAYNNWS